MKSLSDFRQESPLDQRLNLLEETGKLTHFQAEVIKRVLVKENTQLTKVEKEAITELLQTVIAEQVKEPPVDKDINQLPTILVLHRRAIRVYPDHQKVALYWADKINRYISVPFSDIGISS